MNALHGVGICDHPTLAAFILFRGEFETCNAALPTASRLSLTALLAKYELIVDKVSLHVN
jgi:hypothetical protein